MVCDRRMDGRTDRRTDWQTDGRESDRGDREVTEVGAPP